MIIKCDTCQKDNIVLVRKEYNIMRNDLSEQEFIENCCKIADYYRLKEEENK